MLKEVQSSPLALEQGKCTSFQLCNNVTLLNPGAVGEEDTEVDISAGEVENSLSHLDPADNACVLGNIVCRTAVLFGDKVVCRSVNIVNILHESGGDNIINIAL